MLKKPFLKWAGNKYRILDKILKEIPKAQRFVEPFAGSCAVYLNCTAKVALINDINQDLIGLYQHIQANGEEYIKYCESFFTPENNTKEAFLALREKFNHSVNSEERGALLLYLNRHCFNGLVRYNSKGKFNVPFGSYKKPYFPLNELWEFYKHTKNVQTSFTAKDFKAIFDELQTGDVVYCDPPYVPLSSTASFTAYSENSFALTQQTELANCARKAFERGITVILSNHSTDTTKELYKHANIKEFEVQRFISCKGNSRNKAPELLAIYS